MNAMLIALFYTVILSGQIPAISMPGLYRVDQIISAAMFTNMTCNFSIILDGDKTRTYPFNIKDGKLVDYRKDWDYKKPLNALVTKCTLSQGSNPHHYYIEAYT